MIHKKADDTAVNRAQQTVMVLMVEGAGGGQVSGTTSERSSPVLMMINGLPNLIKRSHAQ